MIQIIKISKLLIGNSKMIVNKPKINGFMQISVY